MSNRYSVNDKYTYQDSDVLINRLNIKDAQALEEAEFRYSTIRSVEITEKFFKIPFNTDILNAIHPFREGNGRTQREFINQLALNSNYYVNWNDCLVEDILEATIKSFAQEYSMLSQLIFKNLILFD